MILEALRAIHQNLPAGNNLIRLEVGNLENYPPITDARTTRLVVISQDNFYTFLVQDEEWNHEKDILAAVTDAILTTRKNSGGNQ